jgi:signal transduction histidine kinase
VAAIRFARDGKAMGDAFLAWLGTGCALSALASLGYGLYPSTSLHVLHVADLVRAVAVLAWMIGALLEIRRYWDGQSALARVEERRALARDLHDGLAQELALIASLSYLVRDGMEGQWCSGDGRPDGRWRAELDAATRRALIESRRILVALTGEERTEGDSSIGSLAEAAAHAAMQGGVALTLDLDTGPALEPEKREALARIVVEAVRNAALHGAARRVIVQLLPSGNLRVSDDGKGFDMSGWDRPSSLGLGLTAMRERAEAVGAMLDVQSAPGTGTVLEVSWSASRA